MPLFLLVVEAFWAQCLQTHLIDMYNLKYFCDRVHTTEKLKYYIYNATSDSDPYTTDLCQ